MISPTGERCPVSGVYQEIVPDERLVFSHSWEDDDGRPKHSTTVTLRFEDAADGKTKLSLEHAVFRSAESRHAHVVGWTESLEKLDGLLAELEGARR
jgi:uncharacterized protein YndB with AHSA1/START domain